MVRSREVLSISSLEISKQRLDYCLAVVLQRRVPVMDRKFKVTYLVSFLLQVLVENLFTLIIIMSRFFNVVTRESKEQGVKKKVEVVLKVQFKQDFSYFMWKGNFSYFIL